MRKCCFAVFLILFGQTLYASAVQYLTFTSALADRSFVNVDIFDQSHNTNFFLNTSQPQYSPREFLQPSNSNASRIYDVAKKDLFFNTATKQWLEENALTFIENRGQIVDADGKLRPDILYYSNTKGVKIYFLQHGLCYVFRSADQSFSKNPSDLSDHDISHSLKRIRNDTTTTDTLYRMDMNLLEANIEAKVKVEKEDQIEEYFNYYYAHCPDGITNVHAYTKITYENIYNNIDLVFYGSDQGLKYDFIVKPGGNVSDIKINYTGAVNLKLNDNGSIRITTPLGYIEEGSPRSYQQTKDRLPITNYVFHDANTFSFDVSNYDKTQTLIIDPCLLWATYYGGSDDDDASDIASDASGTAVIVGYTRSTNFPVSAGAFQTTYAGSSDAVIVKFNSNGTRSWATYYGGSGQDIGDGIDIDPLGNIIIVGITNSTDFPVSAGAFQTIYTGSYDAFVAKFNSGGSRVFGTYYGGSSKDQVYKINTDLSGNICFTGYTRSTNFPVSSGAFQTTKSGGDDAYIVKISASGGLLWATYYGGSSSDVGFGIGVDGNGNITIVGGTGSTDFPVTSGAFQTANAGGDDGFVVRFNPSGTRLYATYFGGGDDDRCDAVSRDGGAISGWTTSLDFPVTAGAFQKNGTGNDLFVAVFGNSPVWCTYFGQLPNWPGYSGIYTSNGLVFITGSTQSSTFPITPDAFQTTLSGGSDAFVAKLGFGGFPIWSSFYGGSSNDGGTSITVDQSSSIYITGFTSSTDLPVTTGAFQTTFGGGSRDGFIAKFGGIPPKPNAGVDRTICFGDSTVLGGPTTGGTPPYTYIWSPITSISNPNSPTPIAYPTKSTTYVVQTIDAGKCKGFDTVSVIVNHVIASAGNDTTNCESSPIQIGRTAQGGTAPYTYKWSPKIDINDTTSAITIVHPRATTTYTQTVTDAIGCNATSSVKIIVNPKPIANAGLDQTICSGSSAFIGDNARGGAAPYTYSWSPTNGLSDTTSATTNASPSTTSKYIQTVADANGCVGYDTVMVVVRETPKIHIANKLIEICYGSSAQIGGATTGGLPPYKYQWTPADGLSATNIAMPVAKPSITTKYLLTVTDSNDCAAQDTMNVIVNDVPIANAGPDIKVCKGTSAQLGEAAQGGKEPITYSWSPSTFLNASNIATPLATPLTTTTYFVSVSDKYGCGSSDTVKVTVVPQPTVSIKINGAVTFCEGGSVMLIADPGFVSYNWSSGNTTQSIIAKTSGDYTVTIIDSNGCQATSQPMKITVYPTPKPIITGPMSVCENAKADYSVLYDSASIYNWQISNGTITSGQNTNNIFVQWSSGGIGIVTLTQTYFTSGCSTTIKDTVTISSSLTPKIEPNKSVVCEGDSVLLDAGNGYKTYKWNNGATTQSIVTRVGGEYFVEVSNATGCKGRDTIAVIFSPLPAPAIKGDRIVCVNSKSNYNVTNTNGHTYNWNVTNGSITSGQNTNAISVQWGNAGIGIITITETITGTGCSATQIDTINIGSNLNPTITANGPTTFCIGDSVTLHAGVGYKSYSWNNGIMEESNVVKTSGNYFVTVTDSNGCSGTSKPIAITVEKNLSPKITASGATTFCEGDSVVLDAGSGYASYNWSNGVTTQSIVARVGGKYLVTVTNAGGCSGSDTIDVVVNPKPTPIIQGPNSVCQNSITNYLVASNAGHTYNWNVIGGTITNGQNTNSINVQWGLQGIGEVEIIETISATQCFANVKYTVTIGTNLNPIITSNKTSVCVGDSVTLDAGSGYATYQWYDVLGPIVGSVNQSISVKQSGRYFVTVTDANGCTGTSQPIIITVNKKPVPIISGPTSFCEGDSVTIRASSGYLMYQWSNGLIAQSIIITQAGIYFVTVTDSNGCEGISLQHIVVMNPKPTTPLIGQRGDTLFSTSTLALTYQWFFNGTIIPNATSKELISTQEGFYTVRITDANGCSAFSLPYEYQRVAAATTITLPFLEAAPGEKITIPLMLQSSQNLNSFNAKDFSAEIRLNKNILLPIGSTSSGVIQQQERIIPLAGIRRDSIGSLVNLEFLAVLADVESTTLRIEQFDWSDNRIKVTTQDGEFKMKICREGGARLVRTEGKLSLQQNRPNPYNAATMIEYEIIEKGHTQLYVMNLLGKKLATIVDADLEPGRYEVYFDANALSSGTYYYVLQTPTKALYKIMHVLK